ncbi:Protein export cytoplasm chaperone protein (SecB) [Candidatus Rhodobacter oscarellae]|uniref:Protein-export protein SecB n=1 Tax=Candidatus Rhodobacter oscarellae TaxID=1675527 RepID=A0A0J9E855_9RHOB|nr:protein-export chaperone SecB [Candidatus Rhodobacter lobularis]KMW58907.1 Protein export cytoplasm chaperone protein (SecB) [Candidatus Rhodobacter lobularis]
MAENGGTTPEATEAQPTPQPPKMQVMAQFIRDLSFENIMVQKGVTGGDVTPEFNVQVGLDAKKRPSGDNHYEVVSKYSITSKNKNGGETLFVIELDYAGLFMIDNIPEEQLHPFLMIECPRMLFPFVRRLVSDLTREGGFPPLNMDVVDFVAIYRQLVQQKVAEAQQQPKN